MTTFNHWDRVISTTQKDITVEAQVDFETPEWKVYISEWWKNLNNPMRIVLDKKYLIKKEKKIILTKEEFQKLIYEYYPTPVNVDDLDKELVPEEWFIFQSQYNWRLEYLWPYWWSDDEFIFRVYNSNPKEGRDDKYFLVKQSDIQEWVVRKADVLKHIFGTEDDAMFDVVLDDNENENV